MSHCNGKKSIPVNTGLYNSIKSNVKRKVKRWPSAYASGQLVRMYKQKGGKYRCSKFGSLDRWFKERWVDVCTGKPCGRKGGEHRHYPLLSRRISSKTPRFNISRTEIKRRCAIKHRIKGKRLSFGKSYNSSQKSYNSSQKSYNSSQKSYKLNLTSTKSITSLRKLILSTQPGDCLSLFYFKTH